MFPGVRLMQELFCLIDLDLRWSKVRYVKVELKVIDDYDLFYDMIT